MENKNLFFFPEYFEFHRVQTISIENTELPCIPEIQQRFNGYASGSLTHSRVLGCVRVCVYVWRKYDSNI